MVTSGNQSVEFPSVSIPAGNNVHKEFQMYLDECAARIILGETLTTSAGEKGARSLGEVHQSVSERKFRGDCVRVEETFRRLFRLITMWNVGNGAKAPHLSFEFDDADDKLKRAQILEILWRSGAIPKDVRGYVSRYFGFEIDPDAAARLTAAGGNLPAEKPTMLAASETRLEGLSRALNGKLNVEAAAGAEDAAAEYMRVLEETLAGSPENETPDAFAARLAAGLDANEFSQDRLLSALASAGLAARDRAPARRIAVPPPGARVRVEWDRSPTEAFKFFAGKGVVLTPDAKKSLLAREHDIAFTLAKTADYRLVNGVKKALEKTIKEGGNFDKFRKRVKRAGLEDSIRPARLRQVFRTNVAAADAAGFRAQVQELGETAGFLTYVAINDSRVRPSHAARDGTTLPADDPWWELNTPPVDFNCRCTIHRTSPARARRNKLRETTSPPVIQPKPGFEAPSGASRMTAAARSAMAAIVRPAAAGSGSRARRLVNNLPASARRSADKEFAARALLLMSRRRRRDVAELDDLVAGVLPQIGDTLSELVPPGLVVRAADVAAARPADRKWIANLPAALRAATAELDGKRIIFTTRSGRKIAAEIVGEQWVLRI